VDQYHQDLDDIFGLAEFILQNKHNQNRLN